MGATPWRLAKEELALRLAPVAIDDPIEQALKKVYADPPASIEPGMLPCIVFGQSTLDEDWESALAHERYDLTGSLLLRDQDVKRAVEIVEAYRGELQIKLRKNLTLLVPEENAHQAHAGIFAGPRFTAVTPLRFGTGVYVGCQFTTSIQITVPVEYADSDLVEEP